MYSCPGMVFHDLYGQMACPPGSFKILYGFKFVTSSKKCLMRKAKMKAYLRGFFLIQPLLKGHLNTVLHTVASTCLKDRIERMPFSSIFWRFLLGDQFLIIYDQDILHNIESLEKFRWLTYFPKRLRDERNSVAIKRLSSLILFFFAEIPVFPDHFSLRSTSSASLSCIAMDQSRDAEWGTRYLCYKPALKKLTITWSRNGEITGQNCVNTRMHYERTAAVWKNSFLCVPRDSLLQLSWSISGPLRGKQCLEIRKTQSNRKGYFLCGTSKYKKIG